MDIIHALWPFLQLHLCYGFIFVKTD